MDKLYGWVSAIENTDDGWQEIFVDAILAQTAEDLIAATAPQFTRTILKGGWLIRLDLGKRKGNLRGKRDEGVKSGEWYTITLGEGRRAQALSADDPDREPVEIQIASMQDLPADTRAALKRLFTIRGRRPGSPERPPPESPPDDAPHDSIKAYKRWQKCYARKGKGGHPKDSAIDVYHSAGWNCHLDTASNTAPHRPTGAIPMPLVQGNIMSLFKLSRHKLQQGTMPFKDAPA